MFSETYVPIIVKNLIIILHKSSLPDCLELNLVNIIQPHLQIWTQYEAVDFQLIDHLLVPIYIFLINLRLQYFLAYFWFQLYIQSNLYQISDLKINGKINSV